MKLQRALLPLIAFPAVTNSPKEFIHQPDNVKSNELICNKLKYNLQTHVSRVAETLIKNRQAQFSNACASLEKLTDEMLGFYHEGTADCYYVDKKKKLDSGGVVFFSMHHKGQIYSNAYTFLDELKQINSNSNFDDVYLIEPFEDGYVAISQRVAKTEDLTTFKQSMHVISKDNTKTISAVVEHLIALSPLVFLAGKNEVPNFHRSLFALNPNQSLNNLLEKVFYQKSFPINSYILKTAIENDPNIKNDLKNFLLHLIQKKGRVIDIGRNPSGFAKTLKKVLLSISDECPVSVIKPNEPNMLKKRSLTGSSTYIPLKWDTTPFQRMYDSYLRKKHSSS